VLHPIFTVERDHTGALIGFRGEGPAVGAATRESFIQMHVERVEDEARQTEIVKAIGAVVVNIGKYLAKSEKLAALGAKVVALLNWIRKVCLISPGFQASPTGSPGQTGPPAKALSARTQPDAIAMAARFQCLPLPNLGWETFEAEKARALAAGAKVIKVMSPEFITMIRNRPGIVKWVVLMDDTLVVTPEFVNGVEITHPFLSDGKNVKSAGQATFEMVDGKIVPRNIDLHSGHFQPPRSGSRGRGYLAIGKEAFAIAGYFFP